MNLDGERYSGNILIEQLGEAGQEKLYNGRVLIVGAGGLGSPAALYLAAAGVGTIGLCDDDQVAVSNLQRQVLYTVSDLSRPKVYQAKDRLFGLNPEVNICTYNFRFDRGRELFQDYDFVIDATDNIISKLEISDECVRLEKSFSHGSAMGMSGQTFTYLPGFPSYRDLTGDVNLRRNLPTSKTKGILGSVAGVIGSIQAIEAIKYLAGFGKLLTGKLLIYDGLNMEFTVVKITS